MDSSTEDGQNIKEGPRQKKHIYKTQCDAVLQSFSKVWASNYSWNLD